MRRDAGDGATAAGDRALAVRYLVGAGNSPWTARNEVSHSGTAVGAGCPREHRVAVFVGKVLLHKDFRAAAAVLTHIGR